MQQLLSVAVTLGTVSTEAAIFTKLMRAAYGYKHCILSLYAEKEGLPQGQEKLQIAEEKQHRRLRLMQLL